MKNVYSNKIAILAMVLLFPLLSWGQAYYVVTLAGSGDSAYRDGLGSEAAFASPASVAVDRQGNVYVADYKNNRIRKINPDGLVSTLAGSGDSAFADGVGTAASFARPCGVAVDTNGYVYVADFANHRIRKISPTGVVTTFAGSGRRNYNNGTGTAASFNCPSGVAVDASGNVFVADSRNNQIRKITASGIVSTYAGSGVSGNSNGVGTDVLFAIPTDVAVDNSGNVYVADLYNNCIRKINPSRVVTTLAGTSFGFSNGINTQASFSYPVSISADRYGNVYVADLLNNAIRKVNPGGLVSTIAGTRRAAFADGADSIASFNYPYGIDVDNEGNIYVADFANQRIRKVIPAPNSVASEFSNADVSLYPNPTTGIVSLTTTSSAQKVTLINTMGQVVYTSPAQEKMELNLSHLAKGIYLVQVQSATWIRTERLVVK